MNVVGGKGLNTIIRASIEKKENEIHEKLTRLQQSQCPVYVHHDCRRRFVDLRKKSNSLPQQKKLRSSTDTAFNWETCCFLYLKSVDLRHKTRDRVHQVCTLPIHATLIKFAKEKNDDWGQAVLARLETCNDLVAAEAVYHSSCMANFKLNKGGSGGTRGRPRNVSMTKAFENVCDWLENSAESEVHAIQELYDKMVEDNDGVAYTLKSFREKLKARYKEHVYFLNAVGCKGELVCFKGMTDYILRDLKEQGSDTKEKVVRAAAKIIKEEIREMNFTKDHYPSVSEIEENEKWVPDSLQLFMKFVVPTRLKQVSLSQCIVQAARPRTVISPIPFGVGLNIDKSTGCKQMITHFSRLGFSISPYEVSRFKQSAIADMDKDDNEGGVNDGFKQWVADNVDHNIASLTGKGTFHGMGIVCVDSQPTGGFGKIPRLKERQPAGVFTKHRGVQIVPYHQASRMGLAKFTFELISKTASSLRRTRISSSAMVTHNLLWHSAWFLASSQKPRSNWSGFLQCSTSAITSQKSASTITFLPVIDLSPSDESCIYSTLLFIISQAEKLKVQIPSVTFDQPLWLKAFDIIHAENLPIVCRLGGFHTLMSFLGSIGAIMKGSGLEDLLSEVYAENSVIHMVSGKAVARAIRGHLLVESSLM